MPSATATVNPPTAAATTGVPAAWASMATSPNDSLKLGTATTSAARKIVTRSAAGTGRPEVDGVPAASRSTRSSRR